MEKEKLKIQSAFGFYNLQRLWGNIDDHNEDIRFPQELLEKEIHKLKEKGSIDIMPVLAKQARDELIKILSGRKLFYEPNVKNVEIAIKVELITFYYKEHMYLTSKIIDNKVPDLRNLTSRLDAYQALSSGTIDRSSLLFINADTFKKIIGDKLTEEVKQVIIEKEE